MKNKNFQCPVCDKKTTDNGSWRFTEIDWVCPKCYPLYLKLEKKILTYYFKMFEDTFNEIVNLNKNYINTIQKHLESLEENQWVKK